MNAKTRLVMYIAGFFVLVLGGASVMAYAEAANAEWSRLAWRLIIIGGVALVFFIWDEWRNVRGEKKESQ